MKSLPAFTNQKSRRYGKNRLSGRSHLFGKHAPRCMQTAGGFGLLLSFLIPCLFLTAAYAVRGISPFSPLSLNSMDGYAQYYPMLENMGRAWRAGSPLYSFHGGLGFNLWAQNAYYTNSPLWFLLYPLPKSWHIAAIDLLVMLRLSLSGLTCYLWLNGRVRDGEGFCGPQSTGPVPTGRVRIPVVSALALSTSYALSAYAIAFINQFMWADVFLLLPLTVLGLERLLLQNRPSLYVLSLFFCLWSCFYIGYMVCLFLVLYFLMLQLEEKRRWRVRFGDFVRFAGYSLAAGGLAGVVLIPVYAAIQKTIASGMGFEGRLRWYHSPGELLARFLPFGKISLAYEAPNLYCGVTTLGFVLVFLCSRKISRRKRLVRLFFLLFLLLSLNLNALDYVWHGFHYPNQLPGRESFLLIFLLLSTAADGMQAFWKRRRTPGGKRPLLALSVLLLAGCGLSGVCQLVTQTWASSNASLRAQDEQMERFIRQAEEEPFYRMEWSDPAKLNPGQQYGYRGITWYSSTMSENAFHFFERLGLPVYGARVSTKYVQSDILNTLFAVRYVLEGEEIFRNPDALPLAFLTGEQVLDFDMEQVWAESKREREKESRAGEEGEGEPAGAAGEGSEGEPAGEAGEGSDGESAGAAVQRRLWEAVSGAPATQRSERSRYLAAQGLRITSWKDTCIEGEICCPEAGILFTTLPDDGGWQIEIDGEAQKVITVCSYLCAARIREGKHAVRFRYTPPGFRAGLAVSGVCLLFLMGDAARRHRKKKVEALSGPFF